MERRRHPKQQLPFPSDIKSDDNRILRARQSKARSQGQEISTYGKDINWANVIVLLKRTCCCRVSSSAEGYIQMEKQSDVRVCEGS